MGSMVGYSKAAMERAMKVQEVILRAMAKRITWWQAAEIVGISDRSMRRWRGRYQEFGYDGLFDKRRGEGSPRGGSVGTGREGAPVFSGEELGLEFVDLYPQIGGGERIKVGFNLGQLAPQ